MNFNAARFHRNRSCFLLGASWSHHASFGQRTIHLYLGPCILTITLRGAR